MSKLTYVPALFVIALLGAFAFSAALPGGSPVFAEEAEDGDDDEEEGGEFYEEETSFSGKQVSKAISELKKQGKVVSPKRCYYEPA